MDEFCVSGETIVRNLQLGLRRAAGLRRGHAGGLSARTCSVTSPRCPSSSDWPASQHAVVWRGVPAAVDRTAFWWEAPDGSVVRAEYLPVGYANGAFLPDDPDALVRRMRAHEDELAPGSATIPPRSCS